MRRVRARLPSWRVGRQVAGLTTWLGSLVRSDITLSVSPLATSHTNLEESFQQQHSYDPITLVLLFEGLVEVVEVMVVVEILVVMVVKMVGSVERAGLQI